jgi:hypothetical protein
MSLSVRTSIGNDKCKKNQKKGQIIQTLTLKRKVKCHFMKWNDYDLEGEKEYNASLFSFSTSKLLSFFVSRMSVEESIVEKLQRLSREEQER